MGEVNVKKMLLTIFAAVALFITGNMTITYALMAVIISFQVFADIEQTGAGLTVLRVVSSSIEEAEKVNLLPVMDENGKEYYFKTEMHVLCTSFWTSIYEPFVHKMTWKEIEEHCKVLCRFFDWTKAIGLK